MAGPFAQVRWALIILVPERVPILQPKHLREGSIRPRHMTAPIGSEPLRAMRLLTDLRWCRLRSELLWLATGASFPRVGQLCPLCFWGARWRTRLREAAGVASRRERLASAAVRLSPADCRSSLALLSRTHRLGSWPASEPEYVSAAVSGRLARRTAVSQGQASGF